MPKRILDHDAFSGVTEIFHPGSDGKWHLQSIQDVEPILEANKALATENDGYNKARDLRRAASIPNVVILKWRSELGIDIHNPDHWPAIKRLLNSSEWRHLRTAPGQI